MKNKKGFTLVELLVCIALLGLIATIATISVIGLNNQQKEQEYEVLINRITSSAKAYVGLNKNDIKDRLKAGEVIEISLNELINANLLKDDLTNPKTNEKISRTDKIKITYNSSANEFTYEVKIK